MGPREIKEHPFFQTIDWNALEAKEIPAPFIPNVKSAEDIANIDEEFTSEPAAETIQEDSALLRAHRDNEAFDNFDFVHDTISKNIRETSIMGPVGSMGSSFMEFSSDDGPRFGITEIEGPKKMAGAAAKKQNAANFEQMDLYDMDFSSKGDKRDDDWMKSGKARKDTTQTTAATRDPYDL